jgi:cold shock CspA family protein
MVTRSGSIKMYNENRGFGFIRETTTDPTVRFPERYFHISNVSQRVILKADDIVYFQLVESARFPGRFEAIDVRLTTANSYAPEVGPLPPAVTVVDGGAK